MPDQVVDSNQGEAVAIGEALGEGDADQQGTDETPSHDGDGTGFPLFGMHLGSPGIDSPEAE